jgi:glycosyltransferase involved in cell wall biosynthesis
VRIAFLASGFPDYSVEAATAIAKQSDVLLLANTDYLDLDCDGDKRDAIERAGRLVRFSRKRLLRLQGTIRAWRAIARFQPDAVLAHEHFHRDIAWLQARSAEISKVLLIVHDPQPHPGFDEKWAKRKERWTQLERNLASVFLVHGAHCADLLRQQSNYTGRPIVSVPHGPILRPKAVTPPSHRNRVLMFGRMEEYKGLEVLLSAVRILRGTGSQIEIRLAGAGSELDRLRPAFEALPNCSIESRFIPRELAIEEFRQANVVVAPYTEASQSGVVSAAFANGRGVVASAVGGLPDFVIPGKNGWLVPPNDPAALADALLKVTNDRRLLETLSAGARASAEQEMSWETFADAIVGQVEALSRDRQAGGQA